MPNGNGDDLPVAGYAYTPQEGWVPVQPSGPTPYIQHPTTPDWVMQYFFGESATSTTIPEEPAIMQSVHGARQALVDTASFVAHGQPVPRRWPSVTLGRSPCQELFLRMATLIGMPQDVTPSELLRLLEEAQDALDMVRKSELEKLIQTLKGGVIEKGAAGEKALRDYLKARGYSILAFNPHPSGHGVDVVAMDRRGNVHVFDNKNYSSLTREAKSTALKTMEELGDLESFQKDKVTKELARLKQDEAFKADLKAQLDKYNAEHKLYGDRALTVEKTLARAESKLGIQITKGGVVKELLDSKGNALPPSYRKWIAGSGGVGGMVLSSTLLRNRVRPVITNAENLRKLQALFESKAKYATGARKLRFERGAKALGALLAGLAVGAFSLFMVVTVASEIIKEFRRKADCSEETIVKAFNIARIAAALVPIGPISAKDVIDAIAALFKFFNEDLWELAAQIQMKPSAVEQLIKGVTQFPALTDATDSDWGRQKRLWWEMGIDIATNAGYEFAEQLKLKEMVAGVERMMGELQAALQNEALMRQEALGELFGDK